MKKVFVWFMAALLLSGHVLAAGSGSIQVFMKKDGHIVSGGTLSLYPIHMDFTDPTAPAAVEKMVEYVKEHSPLGQTKPVGEDGSVLFHGLGEGLWLVMQEEAAQGYVPINPFCVSLEGEGQEVTAWPKIQYDDDPDRPQTGDTGNGVVWISLMGVSLVGLVGIGLSEWKKHRGK